MSRPHNQPGENHAMPFDGGAGERRCNTTTYAALRAILGLKGLGLTLTDRAVLQMIVFRANGVRHCSLSYEQIAEQLDISVRTVCGSVGRLRAAGWIAVKRQRYGSNHYAVLDPEGHLYGGPAEAPPTEGAQNPPTAPASDAASGAPNLRTEEPCGTPNLRTVEETPEHDTQNLRTVNSAGPSFTNNPAAGTTQNLRTAGTQNLRTKKGTKSTNSSSSSSSMDSVRGEAANAAPPDLSAWATERPPPPPAYQQRPRQPMPGPFPWNHLTRTFSAVRDRAGTLSEHPIVGGFAIDIVLDRVLEIAGMPFPRVPAEVKPLAGWLADDIDSETIYAAIRERALRAGYQPPHSLAYFDKVVRSFAARTRSTYA